jgi:hypothetical protein
MLLCFLLRDCGCEVARTGKTNPEISDACEKRPDIDTQKSLAAARYWCELFGTGESRLPRVAPLTLTFTITPHPPSTL